MKQGILVLMAAVLVAGCVSPYKIPGGDNDFLVPRTMETRSPFGTNNSGMIIEQCKGPDKVVLFYFDADLQPCSALAVLNGYVYPKVCHVSSWTDGVPHTTCNVVEISVFHGYSQGQGGQIVSGLMNAAALGGVAAAAGWAGNVASSSSSTVINAVVVPRHGHK